MIFLLLYLQLAMVLFATHLQYFFFVAQLMLFFFKCLKALLASSLLTEKLFSFQISLINALNFIQGVSDALLNVIDALLQFKLLFIIAIKFDLKFPHLFKNLIAIYDLISKQLLFLLKLLDSISHFLYFFPCDSNLLLKVLFTRALNKFCTFLKLRQLPSMHLQDNCVILNLPLSYLNCLIYAFLHRL